MQKSTLPKKHVTFYLPKALDEALRKKSYELSLKHGKKITPTMLMEKALAKMGVTYDRS